MQTTPKRLGNILAALLVATTTVSPITATCLRAADAFENSDPVSQRQKEFADNLQASRTYYDTRIAVANQNYDTYHANVLAERTAFYTAAGLDAATVAKLAAADTEKQTAAARKVRDDALAGYSAERVAMEENAAKTKADLDTYSMSDPARATRILVAFVNARMEAAKRETTPDAQALKLIADISVEDIKRYGPLGGPNSIFHDPGQIAGGPNSVINNPGQILGGPNSFFHHNLGL